MAGGGYEALGRRNIEADTIVISIVFGFLFGFAVTKALVYLPSVIFGQLQWTCFLLFKFYLSALSASLLAGSLISLSGSDARSRFEASRVTASNGPVSVSVGAVLLGLGMVFTGTEPSAAFLQAGAGVWSGFYVILGGLIAVVLYGFIYKDVFAQFEQEPSQNGLDNAFKCQYWHVAVPLGLSLGVLCYFIETKFTSPWTSEIGSGTHSSDSWLPNLSDSAWSPYYVGAFVGLLQILLRTTILCLLDSTYAYISAICVPLKVITDRTSTSIPQWFSNHSSTSGLCSLLFFTAASFGACASATLGKSLSIETGFGVQWCLAGGFCLVLGALISGACPTGMAISGCSDLNVLSILGTLIMFASAIGVGIIFKGQDIHPEQTTQFVKW